MVGTLIAGAVVVESVFSWPGVGRLLVVAVANRDLAVVQCILLLVAVTMVTSNLIVDFLYGLLDPRLRRATGAHDMTDVDAEGRGVRRPHRLPTIPVVGRARDRLDRRRCW